MKSHKVTLIEINSCPLYIESACQKCVNNLNIIYFSKSVVSIMASLWDATQCHGQILQLGDVWLHQQVDDYVGL